MKKVLYISILLIMILSISLPIAMPAMADSTLTVVSDATVQVVGVYNKAGGTSSYVDLSGSPLNAVLAAEPKPYPGTYPGEPPDILDSVWDTGTGKYFQDTNPGADWIWETTRVEDAASYDPLSPLYDADASSNGRVVVFQKTFEITGSPEYAALHITADNCYEVWINGVQVAVSDTAKVAGWESGNLQEGSVGSTGWQTVGHYTGLDSYLIEGLNTIRIVAGNEYYHPSDPGFEFNNSPCPPYVASPYRQQNPAALIFKLDIQSVTPPVPELPAGALLGLGLVGLAGVSWFGYRRSRAAKI